MRFFCVLCVGVFLPFSTLFADSFLSDIYNEINNLNLSKQQRGEIKGLIKEYHNFLRQWYADSKSVEKGVLEDFASSNLKGESANMQDSLNLFIQRKQAEQDFLLSVYNVLDSKQRKILGNGLKKKGESLRVENKKDKNPRYKL